MAPNENEINEKFVKHRYKTPEPSELEGRLDKRKEWGEKGQKSKKEKSLEEKAIEDALREINELEEEIMGGQCDKLRGHFEEIKTKTLEPIAKKLRGDGDEGLAGMVDEAIEELGTAIKICGPIVDKPTCEKANKIMDRLMVLIRGVTNIFEGKKETFREKLPSLWDLFQHTCDKLSELSGGTPLMGVFSNLKKIFAMLSGASRL